MKTSAILFAFAIMVNIAFAQTSDCNCNELFDKNIKTEYNSFSAQSSKEILYKYFTSDQTTRQSIKNDNSIEGSVKAVINAIPLDIGFGSSTSESDSKYYYMYQQAVENKYISDELLESLYVTTLPDRLFDAYEKCLSNCEIKHNGIFLRNISTQDDLVVLEMRFKSVPAGAKITIEDAIYSSGSVVGGKKFESGTEITDGQVIYEHIKVNPDEPITVTISFVESGIPPVSLSYSAKNKIRKSTDAPLGTIVASLLNYNDFLKLNGLEYESDVNKIVWVPCDGRPIGTDPGTYGAYSGGKAPDLRGLFLRSVNDMGAYVATVPTPKQENLNPESKQAGQIQMDAFQGHKHLNKDKIGEFWSKQAKNTPRQRVTNTNTPVENSAGVHDAGYGKPRISNETRPKNISVYHYVKIR